MIVKYKPYTVEGPNGYTLHYKDEGATRLGEIGEYIYLHVNEEIVQDERLIYEVVELNEEQKEALRGQRPDKPFARMKISKQIGDEQDLIADAMKLIEFNIMLTARLAGDIWGTNPIDEAKKTEYAERNKAFLDAVDAGAVTLRGDFENMNIVMQRMLERVSKTNQLVRDNYVNEMKRVGLM